MERINARAIRKTARQSALDLIEEIELEEQSFNLSGDAAVEVFQKLVDSCDVWSMQEHYGVMASALIDAGLVRAN